MCPKNLEKLRILIKDGKEVTQEHVTSLADPDVMGGDRMLVPVDMRGTGDYFEDVDDMVKKLGPKGAIEAFFTARDFLVEAQTSMPDDPRWRPMTAAAWQKFSSKVEALLDDVSKVEEAASASGFSSPEVEEAALCCPKREHQYSCFCSASCFIEDACDESPPPSEHDLM